MDTVLPILLFVFAPMLLSTLVCWLLLREDLPVMCPQASPVITSSALSALTSSLVGCFVMPRPAGPLFVEVFHASIFFRPTDKQ